MAEPELRLATWNIHMAVGRDGRRDLSRIVQVIRQLQVDVIGLQEVDNQIEKDRDDLQTLSEQTGFEVIAGPTMQRTRGDYGNALLTRLPVRKVERFDLSFKKREPRGLLIVELEWQQRPLQVAVTHLGLRPGERRKQVRQICHHLAERQRTPLVLMGDFNEWFIWGRPLRWLQLRFGAIRSPATFPARWPFLQLDHILADPAECLLRKSVHCTDLTREASDHLPLVAQLRY
ncbi:MAG: endonuclease/exonuclease/phosphatase family protein [Desulfuromusa sp.]|jgi:endonuclease/exonuclease/phosphatase family metal-dependent hydrolase|nr:endonuclease/exonuclease/phosphatase family protein [Desulfuromusa sp.]